MRAAVYHGQGDLRIESVPDPGETGDHDLKLAVSRAAICGTDSSEFTSGPRMIPLNRVHPGSGHSGPMIIGHEFVGEVTEAGSDTGDFRVGDRVVSGAGVSCGSCDWCLRGETNLCDRYYTLGLNADGGMAEAVISPAGICFVVPESVSDEDAAMTQPLAVAIHALDKGGAGAGASAVIIGVGGIGALMVGAAASRGFRDLIAVDIDPVRLESAAALGATETVDARTADVAATIREITGNVGADVVFEASGAAPMASVGVSATRNGGRVVIVGHPTAPAEVNLADAGLREVDLIGTVAHICGSDIPAALALLESTPIARHVLDRVIPVENLVAEGLNPLAEGRATGKIVVDVRS